MKHYITVIYPDAQFFTYIIVSKSNIKILLERVFKEWNHCSGQESNMFLNANVRSLSVNDVVIIDGKTFLCLEAGWKEISMEEFISIEKSVILHPQRHTMGAWYCLQDVMNQRSKNLSFAE